MAKGLKIPRNQHTQDDAGEGVDHATETTTEETTDDLDPDADAGSAPPQVTVAAARVAATGEKTVLVKPRVSRESFRCAGKFWTCVAGREMRVPAGVAEHMEVIGIL